MVAATIRRQIRLDMQALPTFMAVSQLPISIVIPCFNAAKYIDKTLLSVKKQNYGNLEVIAVDGGSSDQTLELIRAIEGINVKIISEPDRGQLDAVQKGLKAASGQIFHWLNADDVLMPQTLELVNQAFSNDPRLDLIFSDDFAFDEEKHVLSVGATIRRLTYLDHILFYRQMYSECVFWRSAKNKFLPEGYFSLKICTDYAFFANLRCGMREEWVPKRLGAFRIRSGQASQRFREHVKAERVFIRENIYAQHGWSRAQVLARRVALAPSFFALQYLYPRIDSALRKLRRLLTRDRKRKAMTKHFFEVWLSQSVNHHVEADATLLHR
jgi:glycosyltransferase involved in cell wall biosynthesis